MDAISELKVWVRYGKGRPVEVNVPSECNVNDLIEAIKKELSDELKDYDVSQIYLHGPKQDRKEGGEHKDGEEETDYRPGRRVSDVLLNEGVGTSDETTILIRTTVSPGIYAYIYLEY